MTLTGFSFEPALRAEASKLQTLRAARWSALAALVGVLGVGALVTLSASSRYPQPGFTWSPTDVIDGAWTIGYLVFVVLGVVSVSNEHASGLVTATSLAEPRRVRVLLARAVIVVVASFLVAEVVAFSNFFLGHALIALWSHAPNASLGSGNTLRAVFGEGLYAALLALFGLETAAILRQTAGSIATVIAVEAVMPIVFEVLPSSISNNLLEYWPTQAGMRLAISEPRVHTLHPWVGAGELVLFLAALMAVACYVVVRRDSDG